MISLISSVSNRRISNSAGRFGLKMEMIQKRYLCAMNSQPVPVIFQDLGNMPYQAAWDYQEQLLKQKVEQKSKRFATPGAEEELPEETLVAHHLLLVEHPPVYTLGKSGKMEHVLISEADREAKGIEFFKINRGGDITFHGPEQIVGYPILDLEQFYTDIGKYLRSLEEVIILTMAEYGLKGDRSPGETGVWLDPEDPSRARKICAMGIRCSRWITMHGFAFNVNTDLGYFGHIVPCGIENKTVTSMEKEIGYAVPLEEVKEKVKRNFEKVFNATLK